MKRLLFLILSLTGINSFCQIKKIDPALISSCELVIPEIPKDSLAYLEMVEDHTGVPLTIIVFKKNLKKVEFMWEGTFEYEDTYSRDSSAVHQIINSPFAGTELAMWMSWLKTTPREKVYLSDCLNSKLRTLPNNR